MKEILCQLGYVFDATHSVWVKPDYEGINYSDGDEVEGRIASIIQKASDISIFSAELRKHCTDWASTYHLSSLRANILRPFEAMLKGDILEVGAGCGALTRYLGEGGVNVLALEGSLRRAAITRLRTRDLNNVTVLAERFDQFQCAHQFDVVTLIGVLEYANLFIPGKNPALLMLERIRDLIKPGGVLILAIENQLGLKYFAGAPEDHLGQPMVGLEGRYRKDQPQTFGRKVLSDMLRQAGFATHQMFAPFPDYKLPTSIVTEAGFMSEQFDAGAFAWQTAKRDPQLPAYCNFSPELVWTEVIRNGLGIDLANSFLCIASPTHQDLVDANVYAYHYSTDRIREYCKEIVFVRGDLGRIYVRYRSLGEPEGAKKGKVDSLVGYSLPKESEYILGRPLSLDFVRIVTNDGWRFEDVSKYICRYVEILRVFLRSSDQNLELVSPYERLPGNFFDIVPQNIIVGMNGDVYLIDKEWRIKTHVELGYLLFRSLLLLMNFVTRFGSSEDKSDMTRYEFVDGVLGGAGYELKEEDYDRYIRLEASIQEEVTGYRDEGRYFWGKELVIQAENIGSASKDCEERIASLSRAVTDYEGRIAGLNQAIADYEERIAGLKQAVTDYEEQITTLMQVVDDRDAQIASIIEANNKNIIKKIGLWSIEKSVRLINRLIK